MACGDGDAGHSRHDHLRPSFEVRTVPDAAKVGLVQGELGVVTHLVRQSVPDGCLASAYGR